MIDEQGLLIEEGGQQAGVSNSSTFKNQQSPIVSGCGNFDWRDLGWLGNLLLCERLDLFFREG
jgi:hypothetical protein